MPSFFFRRLAGRLAVVSVKKRASSPKFTTLIRLVFDTFGRMPLIARRFWARLFQTAVTRKLVRYSRRAGTLWNFPIFNVHV